MATFSVTTTTDQDAAVQYAVTKYNATSNATPLTALQYAKLLITHLFEGITARYQEDTRTSKAEAYQKIQTKADAGDAVAITDKTTIDTILTKYS